MKSKKILKISLVVFLLATVIYIFSGLKGKTQPNFTTELTADGKGVIYYSWYKDKSNKIKKALELKCAESTKESEDKTLMKKIEGLIYKKGRMNKDIKVFGDQGFTENNFYNFFIEKNARLVSEDFIIASDNFTLKDRAVLFSAPKVFYQTDVLKGAATEGMEFFIDMNSIKFLNAKGLYQRDNKTFNFQTHVLWFMEKEKILVMEKNVVIKDNQSILRSDWVTLKFNQELKQIVEASSQKNSYFYTEDPEKNESKEIKGDNINCLYDTEGHLTLLKVMNNGRVLLKNPNNQILIAAAVVEMNFDGPTGKTKDVLIPMRGIIENTGKTRFKIIADTINVQYNQAGEIRFCEGTGSVEFIVEDYKGTSNKMAYDLEKDTINVEGDQSLLEQKKNTFTSAKFTVKVKDKILSSNAGVKSLIRIEEENALFSTDPIFINAMKFTIYEKEKKFKYEGQVNLTQADTQLTAGSLEIRETNAIDAGGSVSLSFKKTAKDIDIKGDLLTFDPERKQIFIRDNAIVKSGESILRAKQFELLFNDKKEIGNISGEEDIYFTKEDISGSARRVQWLFDQEVMILKGAPQVTNREGHKTSGKELKIDLQTNKITILAAEDERSETIIK